MSDTAPVVYLLDGDDEYAMAEFISKLTEKLGDPTTAEMNTTRLDGNSASLEQIEGAARSMPFLALRRLVIVTHPIARINTPALRNRLLKMLAELPPTAALVLVENKSLTSDRDRGEGKLHWLERWAETAGPRLFHRHFTLPTGEAMARWVQARAKTHGGTFTPAAASALAGLVGDDPRLADQEIAKLLAYVNYNRPVEPDDVEALTPLSARVADFALLNALRARDGRQAQSLLRRMLAEEDAIPLFHSIVSQFRDVLLAREVLEARGTPEDLARQLKIHPFRARKAYEQAQRISLPQLERIYHRLLDLDTGIKTGQVAADLALETLIMELTG